MKEVCGSCNLQGDSKAKQGGVRILCLYDNRWRKDNDNCERWTEYRRMSNSDRLKIASDLCDREERQKDKQETMAIAKQERSEDKKFQIKLTILQIVAVFISGLLIGVFVPPTVEKFFTYPDNAKRLQTTDMQFKKEVRNELERNIRVLQFYVWILPQKWTGDIYTSGYMAQPYLSFFQSKQTILKDVYDIDMLADILKLYSESDIASKKIQEINSSFQRTQEEIGQNIDYFVSLINKSIKLVEKISEQVGDNSYMNKKYLSDDWNEPEILEAISREFIESEKRQVATSDAITFNHSSIQAQPGGYDVFNEQKRK